MSVPEMQARIKGKIWQAIAQSGVNVSSIAQAELDTLVNAIADGTLAEVDTLLGEATVAPSAVAPPHAQESVAAEVVLWEGRPFLSLGTTYTITTERVRIVRGILGKEREDVELVRVQDLDQSQNVGEQVANIGDIHIRSHDPSSPEIILNNVRNVNEVHEILRKAVLEARKRHNMAYREQM